MSQRFLIVNADDLGWTAGVNEGIFEAHLEGVVTSATLMVNAPGAEHAAATLQRPELAGLGVGLHLQLTGGGAPTLPAGQLPSLVDDDGRLPRRPDGLGAARTEEVLAEARAQLARFETLMDRAPTHVDSHHHSHRRPEVLAAVTRLAVEAGLAVRQTGAEMRRHLRQAEIATTDVFIDSFFAEGVTHEHFAELIAGAAAGAAGVSEIMCHPGRVDDELESTSTYTTARESEIEILTDPLWRRRLGEAAIRLVSYEAL